MAINEYRPTGPSRAQEMAESGDKLAQWFGQMLNQKQAEQAAMQQQQLKGQQSLADISAQGEQARQTQDAKFKAQDERLGPYLRGEQRLPQNVTAVSFDGSSVHGVTPDQVAAKQAMLNNRSDQIVGREGKTVQDTFDKLAKEHISGINSARQSAELIKQNNLYSAGPEQIMFVKSLIGSGRLAAQEIPTGAPRTFWSDVQKKVAMWDPSNPASTPVFSPQEQQALLGVVGGIQKEHISALQGVHDRVRQSLPALAPHSTKLGRAEEIMSPLSTYTSNYSQPIDTKVAANPQQKSVESGPVGIVRQAYGAVSNGLNSLLGRAPNATAAPSKAFPEVGEVRGGYRYKGGNPSDQNSWEQVQ